MNHQVIAAYEVAGPTRAKMTRKPQVFILGGRLKMDRQFAQKGLGVCQQNSFQPQRTPLFY